MTTTNAPAEATTAAELDATTRVFSVSILISAIRCTLTYVVFPWLLPIAGVAGGIGPVLGLVIGAVALVSNVLSIRRFWATNHRWKWPVTALNAGVFVLVSILVIQDIAALF